MIAIADSGSSKTDWVFISGSETTAIETLGINPFYQETDQIISGIKSGVPENLCNSVKEVYFFGAGCIKGKTDKIVADALVSVFSSAKVQVEDDMTGAAKALLGSKQGIACILGTGANSCFYNGREITDKIPALGFILGDEGSGAYLGKLFLNDYFKRAIPDELMKRIDAELKLDMAEVLNSVYKETYPSRYLAGFSKFIYRNKNHPYMQRVIKQSFTDFFIKNIERYENYQKTTVNFVGSIAFYYKDILQEVAFDRNVKIEQIIHKPIEGLKSYYSNNK
jgi:N-acetylglucosamine kinase-like BadF-type ATPase